jgi:hypothetical protein
MQTYLIHLCERLQTRVKRQCVHTVGVRNAQISLAAGATTLHIGDQVHIAQIMNVCHIDGGMASAKRPAQFADMHKADTLLDTCKLMMRVQ